MPSLFVYPLRGLKTRIKISFLNLNEKPDCLVVSPGGCGTITLINYLNKFKKTNLYIEKKYKLNLRHIYKPSNFLKKNNIKIILIKRDFEGIYNSMKSRNFIRNGLNNLGDLFPFMYINFLKDEKKLKKKYFLFLNFFYSNWKNYDNEYILRINFKDLYDNKKSKNKIKKFLNINNKNFLENFPKYKRYVKSDKFIDPSTKQSKKILQK
tara:strand:- start:211 stop:837 length:627 start_codon:yes stop_codon:yes gene_type:complete